MYMIMLLCAMFLEEEMFEERRQALLVWLLSSWIARVVHENEASLNRQECSHTHPVVQLPSMLWIRSNETDKDMRN